MTLSHNGYTGSVHYCCADNIYFGKLLHINDLVMYDANTEEELKISFEDAVDDYIDLLNCTYRTGLQPYDGGVL